MSKKRVITIILAVLLAAVAVVAFLLIREVRRVNAEVAFDREAAITFTTLPETVKVSELEDMIQDEPLDPYDAPWIVDLPKLRQINNETIGWIWMPGTEINYPVVQGVNNTWYLNHRYDKSESIEGTIFMETLNDPIEDNDRILYGHNTSSGKFDSLLNYINKSEYITEHPYFIYYDAAHPAGAVYQIFSVFRADVSSSYSTGTYYKIASDEDYPEYLDFLYQNSEISIPDIYPSSDEQCMILSTCCYNKYKRLMVCGIVVGYL